MAAIDDAFRTSFDRNAELYDAARPSYPEALVDEAVAWSGIPSGGRILEVGAGTGKATVAFARRGFAILALEPGPNMAAVLRRKSVTFPAVSIEQTTFEAWRGGDRSFDLVISAQAFHWVDPALRCVKAAAALRPGGALALIRNETSGLEPASRGAGCRLCALVPCRDLDGRSRLDRVQARRGDRRDRSERPVRARSAPPRSPGPRATRRGNTWICWKHIPTMRSWNPASGYRCTAPSRTPSSGAAAASRSPTSRCCC